MDRTPVFELHIAPMFRLTDREHMSFEFDLFDYDDVVQHAGEILDRLEIGNMPPPGESGPWPQEWTALFKRWTESGHKRLELGSAAVAGRRSASAVTITATGTFPAAGYSGWLQLESQTDTAKTYVLYFEPPEDAAGGGGAGESFAIRERYRAGDTRAVFVRDSTGTSEIELTA